MHNFYTVMGARPVYRNPLKHKLNRLSYPTFFLIIHILSDKLGAYRIFLQKINIIHFLINEPKFDFEFRFFGEKIFCLEENFYFFGEINEFFGEK